MTLVRAAKDIALSPLTMSTPHPPLMLALYSFASNSFTVCFFLFIYASYIHIYVFFFFHVNKLVFLNIFSIYYIISYLLFELFSTVNNVLTMLSTERICACYSLYKIFVLWNSSVWCLNVLFFFFCYLVIEKKDIQVYINWTGIGNKTKKQQKKPNKNFDIVCYRNRYT